MTNLQLLKIRIENSTREELISLLGIVNCHASYPNDCTNWYKSYFKKPTKCLDMNQTQFKKFILDMDAPEIIQNFPRLSCDFCNHFNERCNCGNNSFKICQKEKLKFLQQDCSKNFYKGIESYISYKLEIDKNMAEEDEDFYYKLFDLLDNYDWMQDKIQQFHFLNEGYAEGE